MPIIDRFIKNKTFHKSSFQDKGIPFFFITCDEKILHLTFSQDAHQLAVQWLTCRYPGALFQTTQHCHDICIHFREYLAGARRDFPDPFLSLFIDHGTVFQKKTWKLIAKIPYGKTRTYGSLAKELGNIGLSRAVGQACNRNPLALIIPCHRVVGSQGIGGFAGGAGIKEKLLRIEKNG